MARKLKGSFGSGDLASLLKPILLYYDSNLDITKKLKQSPVHLGNLASLVDLNPIML